jgi:hypothetical protein
LKLILRRFKIEIDIRRDKPNSKLGKIDKIFERLGIRSEEINERRKIQLNKIH